MTEGRRTPSATSQTTALPLAGSHALVTGGGKGIGAAIALELAAHGANVTLLGRDERAMAETVDRLTATTPAAAQHVTADLRDRQAVVAAFARAAEALDPPEILVNNAGVAESAPIAKTTTEQWQRMLDVNLTGTFFCIQAALPAMLAAGRGRIVNIASTAGLTGYAYVAAYCAAKHGVIGLTRALARELAAKAITVNAVCPGYTETDMTERTIANIVAKTGRSAEQARADLARLNPQNRLVRPQEVAQAVLYLALPGSAAVTGQALGVDGGEVLG